MADRTVRVRFDGDAKGLARATREGGAAMGKFSVKTAAFGTALGLGFVQAGRAAFRFGKDSVAAFIDAEESQNKLQDAFDRFPRLADTNIGRLRKLNAQLQLKTRFDDDTIESGQAVLASFKLTGRQIENLTPLVADYAAKTGRDLPDAATTLGKAFLGNTRALKELGIKYKSTGDQAKDTANITALLRKQVGGFAEKQGKTAAGQARILANRFNDIQEMIGKKLLPVLMRLADWGLKTIAWVEKNQRVLIPLAIAIAGVTTTVLAVNAAMKVYTAVSKAVKAATVAWTVVQRVLNFTLFANPIGLIILAIVALIAIIVLIATKTKWFQNIWRVAWGGVKAAAAAVGRWFSVTLWGWIRGAFDRIVAKARSVVDWFKKLPARIGSAIAGIAEILTAPFRGAFNAIARLWNNTIGKLCFSIPGWVPGPLGGKGFCVPKLPEFHQGGIVPGFGERLVVARGGEVIFTPEQLRALTTRGDTFNVTVQALSNQFSIRQVMQDLALHGAH